MPDADNYGDQFSEIIEDEDQPARPSTMTRLLGLFGRGKSPAPTNDPQRGTDIDERMRKALEIPVDLTQLYMVYAEMMRHPTTGGIVGTLAEEATPECQERNRVVWPVSPDANVTKELNACLTAVSADRNAYPITESFLGFGNHYERLMLRQGVGVVGMSRLPHADVERVEDAHRRIIGFRVKDCTFGRGAPNASLSYPYDVIHWRMPPGYDPTRVTSADVYGRSMMYAMIRPYKALVLSEDRMLKQRLKRSGGRVLWLVPVAAGATDAEARQDAAKFRKQMSQAEVTSPTKYSKVFNPISDMEDAYMPVREGQTPPSTVQMPETSGELSLDDIEYFTDQIYGVSKMNKGYFGRSSEGVQLDRTKTISQQDLRVARIARRVRSIYVGGLKTICDVHLTTVFSAPESKVDYEAALANYSLHVPRLGALEELDRIEVLKMQLDVAEAMANLGGNLRLNPSLWTAHILITYLKMSPEKAISLIAASGALTAGNPDGPPAESELSKGLHPLNESERRALNELVSDPKVTGAMLRVGELTGCLSLTEDVSFYRPGFVRSVEDLEEYIRHDTEENQKALRENYERDYPKTTA